MRCVENGRGWVWRIGLVVAFCLLVAMRMPGILEDTPLNIDESLLLAAGLTMKSRGSMPWRDFDTTTIGPVAVWAIGGTETVAGPLSYAGVHLLAALVWAGAGVLVVAIGRVLHGWAGALFSFALILCVSGATWRDDYLHFSSELLPSLILSGAALLTFVAKKHGRTSWREVGAGFLCAAAVLGKLQALPIAAFLAGAAAMAGGVGSKGFAKGGAMVFLGGALPLSLLAGWLAAESQLAIAIRSYVLAGASYGGGAGFGSERLWGMLRSGLDGWWAIQPFYLPIAVAIYLLCRLSIGGAGGRAIGWWNGALAGGWFLSAGAAALLPAFRFEHHGVLIVAPAIVLLTFLAGEVARVLGEDQRGRGTWLGKTLGGRRNVFAAFLVVYLAGAAGLALRDRKPDSMAEAFPSSELVRVCAEIEKLTEPGSPVAVWGWAPEIFVFSGRPSASRHIIGHFLVDDNAAREAHRQAFLDDLRASPPKVFIDAVAPGFFRWRWRRGGDAPRTGTFPELEDFILKNYLRVDGGPKQGGAEIYVLKTGARQGSDGSSPPRPTHSTTTR